MIQLPPMPASIEALPRDERGYPVPWFVEWIDGKPEFRVMNPQNMVKAIKQKLCWVCGQPLCKQFTFVLGPMCSINKISAEPPNHPECAEFSAKACPFLSKPKAVRRDAGLPETHSIGVMVERNPGVTCLWQCAGYEIFQPGRGLGGGVLFRVANPSQVRWFREGRKATREEIVESIDSGLVILRNMAASEGPDAEAELDRMIADGMKRVPAE